jgi:hypothetical protein
MKTVKMLKDMGTEYFLEGIVIKGVRERIDIMDLISPIVNDVQVNITLFEVFAASQV